jgi:NTE family protein
MAPGRPACRGYRAKGGLMATRTTATRVGIALGSGVARGWAHIGVLRALERAGVQPDIVCGTSIGALVGGIYLGGRLDALETWARELTKVKLARLFDYELGRGGLVSGRRIMRLFDGGASETLIEQLPRRFACVCTDLDTGHEVWIQQGNLSEAILASCALPGVAPPVNFDGRWLLDGALVNPIPVSVCRALGAQLVIAVNLNADIFGSGTLKAAGELEAADERAIARRMKNLPGAELLRQLVSRWNDQPSILSVMARSLTIVQDRISRSRLAGDPPDVTIAPKLKHIGVFQFDRARESIEAGEAAVEPLVPAIRDTLRRFNLST